MKRTLALALVLSLASLGMPAAAFAGVSAGQQQLQSAGGQVAGTAKHSTGEVVANHGVRLRSAADGQVVGTSTTNGNGAFVFQNVKPGTYVIELLDDGGQVIATSTAVTISAASPQVGGVLVVLNDTAAAALAAAAGGHFFTSTAGILLLVGAGAGTIAIIATHGEKSPSK